MRFRWLLLGALAVGCLLDPQPDPPSANGGPSGVPGNSSGSGTGSGGTAGVNVPDSGSMPGMDPAQGGQASEGGAGGASEGGADGILGIGGR